MKAATGHATATISANHVYRYELRRTWDPLRGAVRWIMLNPSTADARTDDRTIGRCIGFTRAWGYGAIIVHNLFALRATDPRALRSHPDPIGPDNEAHLLGYTDAMMTVCAWGTGGALHGRGPAVAAALHQGGEPLHRLGVTAAGHPLHPLYLPARARPQPWEGGA